VTDVFATGVALGTAVAGIACVNEMNTSGVVVGGSIKTGVSAVVGTSFVGAIFTDTSHARVAITSTHKDKMIFFMVAFPFMLDHSHQGRKTPLPLGEFALSEWIVGYSFSNNLSKPG
jgi:hypothetical protein